MVSTPAKKVVISGKRSCNCPPSHMNCLSAKEWMKYQVGVWQFNYERRDIRDKTKHPASYPIVLARRCIDLFLHQGELIIDPFVGSGTTLVAARDANRNAIGFDIHPNYIELAYERLAQTSLFQMTDQVIIMDDARNIPVYLDEASVACIITSPPYANLLNRKRLNKSRRGDVRKNEQYLAVEQYSQRIEDLETLGSDDYISEIAKIFEGLLPLLKPKGHCLINIADIWWNNKRLTLHVALIDALCSVGYELRNIIVWDRTNIVNKIGIFGWPNNYITMGTTFDICSTFGVLPMSSRS